MSTHPPLETLCAMRRAASDAMYAASERRRQLWYVSHKDRSVREEHLEWSWIAEACKRELRRLNSLIARRKRAQQVTA
jgi:hypothetical protein